MLISNSNIGTKKGRIRSKNLFKIIQHIKKLLSVNQVNREFSKNLSLDSMIAANEK